ncbi:MAG: polysaccharide biosynthesis C-terminal domain-containing protein, partial [Muribaculaceae bacterium]|nr:polysaccharide biosynthesis C-terminal domain-containing protein [Muribaculaceae bacterium]
MASPQNDSAPLTLGTTSVGRLLMQYSVPAIIASVVTSLYNIIDSIFIGQGVNALAISGLAITFPLMNLVMAFVMLIAAGGAAISSIFLGQKDLSRATDVVNNVLVLSLVTSVIVGGTGLLFIDDILVSFGATSETITYAREFMTIILATTPVAFVFIGLNNIMRATGYPKKAMVSALLSVAVNLILCPIFIFKFHWGIAGAAIATVCGQLTAVVWVLAHFLSPKSYVRLRWRNRWLSWPIIRRIYAIGLAPFLMNVCACIVVVFINRSLLSYGGADGNLCVGAYGIVNRVTMLFVMIVFGITQGMQPILGFN